MDEFGNEAESGANPEPRRVGGPSAAAKGGSQDPGLKHDHMAELMKERLD